MLQIIINAVAFYVTSYLVAGFVIGSWQALFIISIVWGILTMLIKPILVILTLPINILSLGLFTFVINAGLLMLMDRLVSGFSVSGFSTALIASVILSIVYIFLSSLIKV